jgi:hypothetical protein
MSKRVRGLTPIMISKPSAKMLELMLNLGLPLSNVLRRAFFIVGHL